MVVYLKNDGLYESKNGEQEKIKNHLYYYFDDAIEIDSNVLVEDLVIFLMKYEKDINSFFNGAMRGFKLKPFFNEMNLKPKTINESVEFVQFSWASDYHVDQNDKNQLPEVSIYMSMYGVSKIKPEHPDDGPINFSLSFCPLNEWKHLPIKLDDILEIYEIRLPKIFERDEKEAQTIKLLSARKEITFYDFVKIFLHEITWYGDPKMRNKKAKEIEDIGKNMDSGSGILDRFDETLLEWKEKELQDCLNNENYEMAIVIQKEIEFLKEKLKK